MATCPIGLRPRLGCLSSSLPHAVRVQRQWHRAVIRRNYAARQDLVDNFYHKVRDGHTLTARRFQAQVEATFQRLASMPAMGARSDPGEPANADLRFFPVSRFRKHMVFYQPLRDGIEILRVLYGARDMPSFQVWDFGLGEDDDGALRS